MLSIGSLREECAQLNIPVLPFCLPENGSVSLWDGQDGYAIGMDAAALDGGKQERVHLAHELGHCVTGSFYNRHTPFDTRLRHEYRADKWAIRRLISEEALDEAIAAGCTEIWALAEHFGVTEEFMRKAVCLHVHGNVAAELYF